MNRNDEINEQSATSRGPCLVDGCACKDARIVSRRRAAYFAARARQTGQTADRVIRSEPGWYLPGSTERHVAVSTAALTDDWPTWHLGDLSLSIAAND
jgi:hypothetical protein